MKNLKFTLIKLLGVIAVIVILAGIMVAIMPFVNKRMGDAKSRAIMKSLEAGLAAYKEKYGFYPMSMLDERKVSDDVVKERVLVLGFVLGKRGKGAIDNPSYSSLNEVEKMYADMERYGIIQFLDFEKLKPHIMIVPVRNNPDNMVYVLLDGYGTPIVYCSPGLFNKHTYDMGSLGYDRKIGDHPYIVKAMTCFQIPPLRTTTGHDYDDESQYFCPGITYEKFINHFGKQDDLANFVRPDDTPSK